MTATTFPQVPPLRISMRGPLPSDCGITPNDCRPNYRSLELEIRNACGRSQCSVAADLTQWFCDGGRGGR